MKISETGQGTFLVQPDGWLSGVRIVPSPNFNARPAGALIDMLVVHNISLPPGQFDNDCVERFFCNQLPPDEHPYFETIDGLCVSSHLLIKRSGEVIQFVSLLDRAWHAGQSCWQGQENCNDFSVGIELEGADEVPYEAIQYRQLAALIIAIEVFTGPLQRDRIVGHSDIAPGRKTDPGPAFNWSKLWEECNKIA